MKSLVTVLTVDVADSVDRGGGNIASRPHPRIDKLSPGQRDLTREEVVENQRTRMFTALAVVTAKKGYAETTVADVIAVARVSRQTFYREFDDKQACFLAAHEYLETRLVERIGATPVTGTRLQRFDVLLGRYLEALAEQPESARLCLVEVYAAGPAAVRRRVRLEGVYVERTIDVFRVRSAADRFACQALIATVSALVTNALVDGGGDAVLALRQPLLRIAERMLDLSPGSAGPTGTTKKPPGQSR